MYIISKKYEQILVKLLFFFLVSLWDIKKYNMYILYTNKYLVKINKKVFFFHFIFFKTTIKSFEILITSHKILT